MTSKTKMVRDALGSPVPQTLNEDGTYTVLANGDITGINFKYYKLLRDALGSPLPYQYFDVEQMKFVPGMIGGGGGSGGAVDSVNGKSGVVVLKAGDVGAASAQDLSTLSQTVTDNQREVTEHLDETTWYEAILVNGFTGTVTYSKNAHGTVFVWLLLINITSITGGTVVTTLPLGFRPATTTVLAVSKSNIQPYDNDMSLVILPNGEMSISANNTLTVSSDAGVRGGVVYYASN